jgi:dTDP-4-amino-4,6-dideoxygalactose transaminase
MPIPLLDLKAQFASIESEVRKQIDEVLASQHFILGPKVVELEAKLAALCETPYAVGVASGSDALLLALMAIDLKPGECVITSAYSFFASCGCVSRLGGEPLFCDIDLDTYNLDPERVQALINEQCEETAEGLRHKGSGGLVRALIPVHLYGQCAAMGPLVEIAKRYRLVLIEDAAQAIGARYEGRPACSFSDLGCLSFFPSKNLGCYGDGGMVTAHSKELADKVRKLRAHGSSPKYFHPLIGTNSRLDALQAAILLAKLPHLETWNEGRRAHAAYYDARLTGVGDLVTPTIAPGNTSVYNQYILRSARRDELLAFLKARGIDSMVYYPLPLHLQECYAGKGWKEGDMPNAERAAKENLSIPVYPELTPAQLDTIAQAIVDFFSQ